MTPPTHRSSNGEGGEGPLPRTWEGIPQIVPSSWCFACDVCCRFPEKDSFLAPYFTAEEIGWALRDGVPARYFSDAGGCKIELTPYGEGYVCPAFSPDDHRCRIYAHRPLDCRIYPFALMNNPSGNRLILGIDMKCPFVEDAAHQPAIAAAEETLASLFDSPPFRNLLRENSGLINRWQDDVEPLKDLGVPGSRGL
ncbi:MAG: YkgJ family cysteine cluster protein [Nitrospirae bacterium]|nr:YkgJ family cysteine cluster protein [Nitrospirota bacterium]